MKLTRLLVPLDGSPLAETALPAAAALAQATGATLLLLRAAEAHTFPGGDPTDAQVKVVREAEEYLASVAEKLRGDGVTVETAVWYGPPSDAIVEGARFNHADMVVITTHGRSGLGRVLLGSVAESVLRATSTPILVLHPEGAPLSAPTGNPRPAPCFSGLISASGGGRT